MVWTIILVAAFFVFINILNSSGYTEECPNCKKNNKPDVRKCVHCNYSLPLKCKKCSKQLFSKDPFCSGCGTKI
ncbi:MAG: zinc ribbon domain-containing protein [Psychrobacillus psychrodurans]